MLTDTKIRSLKPTGKLYKVADRDGLYVAVTPSGAISFRYNYKINGRQETLTLGTYGIGGIASGSYTSGTGGDFSGQTFKIPAELAGSYRIAIRLATEDGFSAYNWFFNNTTE